MDHNHEDPIIWEVVDILTDMRLGTLVKHTREEAEATAYVLFGRGVTVLDTGKRKPDGKCCSTCGDTPCGKRN